MKQSIKPIPTKYKGILFRSRLEARWAVFFDELRLEWEYEVNGFDLDGIWYLPDLWLPQVKMWAEIKPVEFTAEERKKAKLLTKLSGYECLELVGQPADKPYWAHTLPSQGYENRDMLDYCLTNYHDYPKCEGRFYCSPGEWDHFADTQRAAMVAKNTRF